MIRNFSLDTEGYHWLPRLFKTEGFTNINENGREEIILQLTVSYTNETGAHAQKYTGTFDKTETFEYKDALQGAWLQVFQSFFEDYTLAMKVREYEAKEQAQKPLIHLEVEPSAGDLIKGT